MADDIKAPAAPAPAAAPNTSPAPNSGPTPGAAPSNPNLDPVKTASTPPAVTNEPGVRAGTTKGITRPGAGLITNPTPVVDPDVAAAQAAADSQKLPASVPQSTLDEMAAGKKALERNRPVATALENARAANAGVSTTPETNPVDATHSLQQQGKV